MKMRLIVSKAVIYFKLDDITNISYCQKFTGCFIIK